MGDPSRNIFGASLLGLGLPFGDPSQTAAATTTAAAAGTSAAPASPQSDPEVQIIGTRGGLLREQPAASGGLGAAAAPVAAPAPEPIVSSIPDVSAAQSPVLQIPNLSAWIAQGNIQDLVVAVDEARERYDPDAIDLSPSTS